MEEVDMKKIVVLLTLCLFVAMVTNALPEEDKINIQMSWAFMNRFQAGSQQLGFPEGNVLQVGCLIKPAGSPIKEVTVKNLDTGLVLTVPSVNVGNIWSGLYEAPWRPFDPSKHMGVWEFRVKDEKGNEATAKTHKLDMKGEMPYLEDLKASGNPLAPLISWSAPNEKDIPQGAGVRYRVRLLKDMNNQFYKSKIITNTTHQIPEGTIKTEDLSKIYVRVECQGWAKNDKEHPLPLELQSQTFMTLKEALGNH
jgi:hypothetical protein